MKVKFIISAFIICCCLACMKDTPIKATKEYYPLPGDRFFPEGIAYSPKTGNFYTGSTVSGDIMQVNVETGATSLFAAGAKHGRTFCTGMKLDSKDRLWVCGGGTGLIQVLDAIGNLVKSWDTRVLFNSGFINDCIISDGYIYFTDSQVRKIYRASVSGAQPGDLVEWLTFTDQQLPYLSGTNANGIEVTPDGKYLIVVVSSSGKLYRINIANKSISEILVNATFPSGDGLLLDKNILYVSPNATGKIYPVTLNSTFSSGSAGTGFGENLIGNTTLAKVGKYLLVVNGQLSRRSGTVPPELPFKVSRVLIP
jgi:Cu-Zn family superoxide dismutase